jgi:hypothetical protein
MATLKLAQPAVPALQSLPGANCAFLGLTPAKIRGMVRRRLEHVRRRESGILRHAILGISGGLSFLFMLHIIVLTNSRRTQLQIRFLPLVFVT